MAGFLYFIAGGATPPTPDKIREWGLGYAFSSPPEFRATNMGPGGGPGGVMLDSARSHGKVPGFHPDQQAWHRLPNREGRPESWVGMWNESKPSPTELTRRTPFKTPYSVVLGDGQSWPVPQFAEIDREVWRLTCLLDAELEENELGQLVPGRIAEEYEQLWERLNPVFAAVCFGETQLPFNTLVAASVDILATQYFVGQSELVLLKALRNNRAMYEALLMSCAHGQDLLEAIDNLKKTPDPSADGGLATPAGNPA